MIIGSLLPTLIQFSLSLKITFLSQVEKAVLNNKINNFPNVFTREGLFCCCRKKKTGSHGLHHLASELSIPLIEVLLVYLLSASVHR